MEEELCTDPPLVTPPLVIVVEGSVASDDTELELPTTVIADIEDDITTAVVLVWTLLEDDAGLEDIEPTTAGEIDAVLLMLDELMLDAMLDADVCIDELAGLE